MIQLTTLFPVYSWNEC